MRTTDEILYDARWMAWVVKMRTTPEAADKAYMQNEYWNWFTLEYESATYADDTDLPWEPLHILPGVMVE